MTHLPVPIAPLRLDLVLGGCLRLRDQFWWDLHATAPTPEEFAAELCADSGVDPQHGVAVAAAIRIEVRFGEAMGQGRERSSVDGGCRHASPPCRQHPSLALPGRPGSPCSWASCGERCPPTCCCPHHSSARARPQPRRQMCRCRACMRPGKPRCLSLPSTCLALPAAHASCCWLLPLAVDAAQTGPCAPALPVAALAARISGPTGAPPCTS